LNVPASGTLGLRDRLRSGAKACACDSRSQLMVESR